MIIVVYFCWYKWVLRDKDSNLDNILPKRSHMVKVAGMRCEVGVDSTSGAYTVQS